MLKHFTFLILLLASFLCALSTDFADTFTSKIETNFYCVVSSILVVCTLCLFTTILRIIYLAERLNGFATSLQWFWPLDNVLDRNPCDYFHVSARAGTVYRNTDNITVCLFKNGYRFLHLLPKIIVNLLWLTCEHVSKLIQHNKSFSVSNIVVFLSFSAAGYRTFTVLLNRTPYTHAHCSFFGCEFHIRMRTGAANLCASTLCSFFGCELYCYQRHFPGNSKIWPGRWTKKSLTF